MKSRLLRSWLASSLALLASSLALLAAAPTMAANAVPTRAPAMKRTVKAKHREVELFAAMKSGELKVQFIPRSSKGATILIKNTGKGPVSVKLPNAFAGVPIQRQFGGGGMGGMGGGMGGMGGGMGGMGGGGGGGQGMGGGMGGMGGGMGGMGGGMGGMGGGMGGGGGGFFNVAPEKAGRIKVTCICLEHGKPEPNARMKYTIIPIDVFTKDASVVEICKMLGNGDMTQNTAQAAAWHLTDRMSWAQLSIKDRVRLLGGRYTEKYFSRRELMFAVQVVRVAQYRATLSNTTPVTPGKSSSFSQR